MEARTRITSNELAKQACNTCNERVARRAGRALAVDVRTLAQNGAEKTALKNAYMNRKYHDSNESGMDSAFWSAIGVRDMCRVSKTSNAGGTRCPRRPLLWPESSRRARRNPVCACHLRSHLGEGHTQVTLRSHLGHT